MENLSFVKIIEQGFKIGLKNFLPILTAFILWLLTCWIPYLNIGTTIGLFIGVVVEMSKGNIVSPLKIFDKIYRKRMGEVLLTGVLINLSVLTGLIGGIIPAIVFSIAWGFSAILVIDKEMDFSKAIAESNRLTYGKKWNIFGAYFFFILLIFIVSLIFLLIFRALNLPLGITIFFGIIILMIYIVVFMGMEAHIYSEISKNI
jgi:hypothetical protein